MGFTYKRATYEDIDILTKTRIEVLRAANQISDAADMSEIERESYNYYQKALCDGSHIAYLVFDGSRFVAAGGVSFFQVMPTYNNSSGKKAYIMNMYTKPEYRRRGIASKTLDMLIRDIRKRGITAISLEATEMDRKLYEKYGFIKMKHEMELPEQQLPVNETEKQILLDNIAKIHTTDMGVDRIKKNLKLDTDDVVEYCKNKILEKTCNIYKQGKNWYCENGNIRITIHSYSYTIITAHILKK